MDPKAFLEVVCNLIRQNPPSNSAQGLPAARVGHLLRARMGLDWVRYGYPKLSAVLSELQAAGRIRVGSNDKGALAVWVTDAVTPASDLNCQTPAAIPQRAYPSYGAPLAFKRLRSHVWYAFVSNHPEGRRLMNRRTGEVWLLPQLPPGDQDQWVGIDVIPQEEQRRWAMDYLREIGREEDGELHEIIGTPEWFRTFTAAIRSRAPHALSGWNRLRSQRVQMHVEAWAERSEVPQGIIFEPRRSARPVSVYRGSVEMQNRSIGHNGDELREALLGAIGQMTTQELMAIPVPARYLVRALRPELVPEKDMA